MGAKPSSFPADQPDRPPEQKRADYYDDPGCDYAQYWQQRAYEHAAEEIAIRRLLRGRHAVLAVDIGGGYGRLSALLAHYADRVIVAEPSSRQLEQARLRLHGNAAIEFRKLAADDLQLPAGTVGLALMVRVVHHLPDPAPELAELARILSPEGCAVIQMANYAHIGNRLRYMLRGRKLPLKAVNVTAPDNQRPDSVPLVNHNPYTFMRQLAHAGLRVERVLSVSNVRGRRVRRLVPPRLLLAIERQLQAPLGRRFFAPSIFYLVRKAE